jgi:hypothetical protein
MKPDAGGQLTRAVRAAFASPVEIEALDSRAWASITFSGERHRLTLAIAGEDAEASADSFLEDLGEREFVLRGHILADISCVDDARAPDLVRLTLEALTIEDC